MSPDITSTNNPRLSRQSSSVWTSSSISISNLEIYSQKVEFKVGYHITIDTSHQDQSHKLLFPTHSIPSNMPPLTGDPKQHDPSKFADGMTGSCLCGSIQVTILAKDLFEKPRGHLCSCANCRKVAGSYVASNMLLDASEVKIEDRDGTLKSYDDKATGSGNSVFRYFCEKDGK